MQNNDRKMRPQVEQDVPIFEDDPPRKVEKIGSLSPQEKPAKQGQNNKQNQRAVAPMASEEGSSVSVFDHISQTSDDTVTKEEELINVSSARDERTPVTIKKNGTLKLNKRLSPKSLYPILEKKADALISTIEIPKAQPQTAPLVSSMVDSQYYLINKATGEVITITETLKVGNDASFADYIPLKNKTVSQKHAVFTVEGNVLMVKDVGSSNGTYINGSRIPVGFNIQLAAGNVVALSNEAFVVQKN